MTTADSEETEVVIDLSLLPECVRVFVGEHIGDTDEVHDVGCGHEG